MNSVRTFPATLDGHRDAMTYLDGLCLNPRVSIVFDELGSNIVRCSGAKSFTIDFTKEADIRMVISDDGVPFDPTAVADPDVTQPAEARKVGGLGLLMVKKMSKSFSYRREGDRNITEVIL